MIPPVVHIVDDDLELRTSLEFLLSSAGYETRCHESAEVFLANVPDDTPGCILLDVRMPGMSGLELHKRLRAKGWIIPVLIISAHADVPMAVQALEAGAFAFLEKPFTRQALLERISQALTDDGEHRVARARHLALATKFDRLTPREREVVELVIAGKITKEVATELKISARTVESHRAHIMEKLGADSIATLVRMAMEHKQLSGK